MIQWLGPRAVTAGGKDSIPGQGARSHQQQIIDPTRPNERCGCSATWSCATLCDPTDCSPPGSSVQGTPQQEYWSGLPGPPPGDLPDPWIEPTSLMFPALAGGFFTTSSIWEALRSHRAHIKILHASAKSETPEGHK